MDLAAGTCFSSDTFGKNLMNMMMYIQHDNAFAVLQQLVEKHFLHLSLLIQSYVHLTSMYSLLGSPTPQQMRLRGLVL
jgi:hypothetical protein